MIHQQPNPGVHYEYVIMGTNAISPQVPPHRRPGKISCVSAKHAYFLLKPPVSSCASPLCLSVNMEKTHGHALNLRECFTICLSLC